MCSGRDPLPSSPQLIGLYIADLVAPQGKTGRREAEIARGSTDQICPVHALTQWLPYARIDFGPLRRSATDWKRCASGCPAGGRAGSRRPGRCGRSDREAWIA